tara:strand:- start:861 stop:1037 length:177 start_codon:yes stop_codon:yes gene_type:complete
MAIKITEKMVFNMKSNLHYKDKLSIHELMIALSQVTYDSSCMENNVPNEEHRNKWRRK